MDNFTQIYTMMLSMPYDLPKLTDDYSLQISRIAITRYIMFFLLAIPVHIMWSSLRTKRLTQSLLQKRIWYSHKDPVLGLDLLWICAKAVQQHKFLETTALLLSSYGRSVSYLCLGRHAVFTIDPINLKAMLSDSFHDFGHGSTRKLNLLPLFGDGIFNSDGSTWKNHRRTLRPILSQVRETELSIFEKHLQRLISAMPKDGSTIDIQTYFSSFTLDISTDTFLGTSTNLLCVSGTARIQGQEFATAFDYLQRSLSGIDDFNVIGLVRKMMFGNKRFKNSLKCVHDFVDRIVERAVDSHAINSEEDFTQHKNCTPLFDSLLNDGQGREDIKYNILNLIVAGRDTMAACLSSLWYVLSKRPDVYRKIRDEINVLDARAPSIDELNQFPYLRMVLQEVLRLYPPVPANQRTAVVDTSLPHGSGPDGLSPMQVRRGTSVGYSLYAMHRLPDFFGEDAEDFRPERWVNIRPSWAFMPFHAGPRICIGQQFALVLAKYSTIRMIQHFSSVEDRNEKPWQEKLGLTCSSKNGVKIGLIVEAISAEL